LKGSFHPDAAHRLLYHLINFQSSLRRRPGCHWCGWLMIFPIGIALRILEEHGQTVTIVGNRTECMAW